MFTTVEVTPQEISARVRALSLSSNTFWLLKRILTSQWGWILVCNCDTTVAMAAVQDSPSPVIHAIRSRNLCVTANILEGRMRRLPTDSYAQSLMQRVKHPTDNSKCRFICQCNGKYSRKALARESEAIRGSPPLIGLIKVLRLRGRAVTFG